MLLLLAAACLVGYVAGEDPVVGCPDGFDDDDVKNLCYKDNLMFTANVCDQTTQTTYEVRTQSPSPNSL